MKSLVSSSIVHSFIYNIINTPLYHLKDNLTISIQYYKSFFLELNLFIYCESEYLILGLECVLLIVLYHTVQFIYVVGTQIFLSHVIKHFHALTRNFLLTSNSSKRVGINVRGRMNPVFIVQVYYTKERSTSSLLTTTLKVTNQHF